MRDLVARIERKVMALRLERVNARATLLVLRQRTERLDALADQARAGVAAAAA
ncbi:hypothetical protein [Longimicrobium sp.]|uniref:hypothetical protein n=1 Tax=Longimicrobium sp. TaxID=2029185 RepID=UPI002E37B828|nr:hypothetical protein [Longimicrobium sp.]HEX6039130.1 hypothetical protein [Longimicrobium sp.]